MAWVDSAGFWGDLLSSQGDGKTQSNTREMGRPD